MELDDLVKGIEKDFGKGSIMSFDKNSIVKIDRINSGSLGLDVALGGGYPKGRIVEIYGPESSGKSTLCLHAIAEVHKSKGRACYIDAEHAFDRSYAEDLGVEVGNSKKFLISQPDNGEQALEIARKVVSSGLFDIVVVDSVAALTPKAEIDGEVGDSKMGLHARMMSQAMRMLVSTVSKTNTCVIFVNQLRMKIGVMFGNPETTTGGNALKFYASVRLDVRRIGQNKDGEEVISNKTRVKIIKNKVAPPFKKAEFDIVFGEGIDTFQELINIAVEMEIVKKAGSWFSYDTTKLGQGNESVKSILRDNPELYNEIHKKVLKELHK